MISLRDKSELVIDTEALIGVVWRSNKLIDIIILFETDWFPDHIFSFLHAFSDDLDFFDFLVGVEFGEVVNQFDELYFENIFFFGLQ